MTLLLVLVLRLTLPSFIVFMQLVYVSSFMGLDGLWVV